MKDKTPIAHTVVMYRQATISHLGTYTINVSLEALGVIDMLWEMKNTTNYENCLLFIISNFFSFCHLNY